jgi:acetyltransferase-like isoleucine patch superfamily enzyme
MSVLKLAKPLGSLISYLKYRKDRLRIAKRVAGGLRIGRNVYIQTDVDIDDNYPFLIEIEDNCRISMGVRILAHDATVFRDLGVTRVAPVRILEGSFIGERVIILPGVTIGPGAVIAAGAVVNRDIGAGAVAAGNPARPYGQYGDMRAKLQELAGSSTVFDKKEIERGSVRQKDIVEAARRDSVAWIHGVPERDPYYVNADMNEIRQNAARAFRRLKQATAVSVPEPSDSPEG